MKRQVYEGRSFFCKTRKFPDGGHGHGSYLARPPTKQATKSKGGNPEMDGLEDAFPFQKK